MSTFNSLIQMFVDRVTSDAELPALLTFQESEYQPHTWNQIAEQVARAATLLQNLGVQRGDRVVTVAENSLEWIVADLAIQSALAVHVPIHATLSGTQIAQQIIDSQSNIVLLSTAEQVSKLADLTENTFSENKITFLAFEQVDQQICDQTIDHWQRRIEETENIDVNEILHHAATVLQLSDLVTILYTSGTTGQPKGVMLSHGNLVSNTLSVIEAFGMKSDDRRLTFLPLSHIFARTCDLYTWIARGSTLALARSRETILEDCQFVEPTLINGVPYFFDKVAKAAQAKDDDNSTNNLREMLGGKISMCCSGGAALPDYTAEFFFENDIPLLQGYGLSETSPVITLSTKDDYKIGSSGKVIDQVEIDITAEGEIITRGPHIMQGYWQREDDTTEVIKDGWFYTGDLGKIDDEGFLFITGRKKEIIVTSLGKNVAPVFLETLLTADPLISQAVVIGDGRKYLTALIVPDADNLRAEIFARKIAVLSREQAVVHPEVRELYQQVISQRLQTAADFEQIGQFTVMSRGFTIESGELTPTLKLRRAIIEENCAAEIQQMYSS